MNDEIKLDHFKDLEELKQNLETWIKEDEMYWNRWFSLYDLKTLLDYITKLQKENKRLKEEISNSLNDEVEIIEEKKIPKKIPADVFEDYTKTAKVYQLYKLTNEILDYLESKEKGE